MYSKNISALLTKCPSCGDDMIFDPDKQCLFCSTCQSQKEITKIKEYEKHPFNKTSLSSDDNEEWAKESKVMKCQNCGASVVLQGYMVSANCPYCSTSLVASETGGAGLKPDAVVPFKFGRAKAEELFKVKINKNWLVPKKLKKNLSTDDIQAYYFPAFVFDCDCHSVYKGVLYNEYTEKDKDGHSHTKRSYFNISGQIATTHQGVEAEASSKLSQEELNWVRPYYFTEACTYSNEYISGYYLECHSDSVRDSYDVAKSLIYGDIRGQILSRYHYDGVNSLDINTSYSNQKYSYCILPMYRINFKYKKKTYSNVMNGQTGALGGKLPRSGWKISLIVLLPILIFAIIMLLTMI